METIITQTYEINKFLSEKNMNIFSSVPQTHINEVIRASLEKGFSGKTTDFAELKTAHRTTIGHFLSKGKWDESRLEEAQKRESFRVLSTISIEKNEPVYVSIDDTVIKKTKPSSHAKRPMEGAKWHYSHTDNKIVYGYNLQVNLVSCGDANLCYSMKRCCEERGTKVGMLLDTINELPKTNADVYLLMDSWYTSAAVFNTCMSKGVHMIGALKTNRIIYPNGNRISIQDFAPTISADHFRSVTVKGQTYMVYRYEGALNKIDKAVVLISYKKGNFGQKGAVRAYICSDLSLTDEEILEHYSHRWKIETFFKQQKGYFAIGKFMIRSAKAIDRFLLIMSIGYFFCVFRTGVFCKFGQALKSSRARLSA